MKCIKFLVIIWLIGSLPLVGCAPIATSESSATAAGSSSDSKSGTEKPWIVKTGGKPTSIAFSSNGKFAAVTNLNDNTVSVYTVDPHTGVFTLVQGAPFKTGGDPESVAFSPNGKLAAVINTDDNTTSVYTVDAHTGSFTLVPSSPFVTKVPVSIAFSPNGQWAAVINILGSKINVYSVDAERGIFTPVKGSPFATGKWPNFVAFSPNGKFAAVTNTQNNTISAYTVSTQNGTFTPVQGSPFATGSYPRSVAFSPNGKFAAVTNYKNNTVSVYIVDAKSGAFIAVRESPFATGSHPFSVAFSPNGKFAVVTNENDNKISVYRVDADTGIFVQVQDSPFVTGTNPGSVAFSPTSEIAAVVNSDDDTLWIYEVDEQTGKFTPITGSLLHSAKRKEEFKKTKESFAQFGQQKHATEEGQQAGFDSPTPGPIEEILGEYIVAPKAVKETADITLSAEESGLQEALAQTQKDRLQAERNKPLLFAAIKSNDLKAVQENLTPFTINSINEQRRTPLMEALYYGTAQNNQNKDLINLLLTYQGIAQETSLHKEIIITNTAIGDAEGDTALMLAIRQKKFELALIIAQHMKPSEFAIKDKEGKTALDLLKEQPSNNDTWLYESLLGILQSSMSK